MFFPGFANDLHTQGQSFRGSTSGGLDSCTVLPELAGSSDTLVTATLWEGVGSGLVG